MLGGRNEPVLVKENFKLHFLSFQQRSSCLKSTRGGCDLTRSTKGVRWRLYNTKLKSQRREAVRVDGCVKKTSDLNRGDTVAVCFKIIVTTVATETPKVFNRNHEVKTLLTLASSHFTPNLHLSLKITICFLFLQIQPNLTQVEADRYGNS